VRLNLLFSAQYAVYIASDPARLAELESWKNTGHEIGAYHQGPDSGAWDGYSDLPGKALARAGKGNRKGGPVGGHQRYFAELARLAGGIKSGCMLDGADKKFQAAAPAYEICGAPEENKKNGGAAGVNGVLFVSGRGDKLKKRLSSFHPGDKAGIEAAKRSFSSLQSGVYGASFKSSPSEFGDFYAWLSFLKNTDPQALRSRTVSVIVESGLLTEKKETGAAAPAGKSEKQAVAGAPGGSEENIPRLKPVPFLSGKESRVRSNLHPRGKNMWQRGYCGDGICSPFERARPGNCPGDCGR